MRQAHTLSDSVYASFLNHYPEYKTTLAIDEIRTSDYLPLSAMGEVYLDYTGGGRFALSQLREHMKLLEQSSFGNPHSTSEPSMHATELLAEARQAVLAFFQASPDEYCVIFTPNATGALRLIGESYPFHSDGAFLYTADNHNSVSGIREFARTKGARVSSVPSIAPLMHLSTPALRRELAQHPPGSSLFAFPAQSNFSGVQHDLALIKTAHDAGWDVLLDAAAFAPTNRLNLSSTQPDFVCLSFYKMFGWPTGIGALIARNAAIAKLHRPWFAGGSIWAVSVAGNWHIPAASYEAFEDGTVNYLNTPGVTIGLKYLQGIGIDTIHTRTMCLTDWTLEELKKLKHANDNPVCEIYGPATRTRRGPTIACNFLTPQGVIIDERIVEQMASRQGIALRTGCFCNPGSGEVVFNLQTEKLQAAYDNGTRNGFSHYLHTLGLQSGGAIRISFGEFSNFADAESFINLARKFQDTVPAVKNLPDRSHC